MIRRGDPTPIKARGGRPASSRGRKKEEEIVAAAARIFNEKGYAATSIRDIADAVGLLKGSLYYYVPSKEDLLYKIIVAVHSGAMANLRQAAETPGTALDRLVALIRGHLRHSGNNLVMIRVFYVDFTHLSPERHARILVDRDRYERFLTDIIEKANGTGSSPATPIHGSRRSRSSPCSTRSSPGFGRTGRCRCRTSRWNTNGSSSVASSRPTTEPTNPPTGSTRAGIPCRSDRQRS